MIVPIENRRQVRGLLLEALRRYTRFHKNEPLTKCWTGLGYVSEYAPAIKAGLIESATDSAPRCMRWFRLTETGATIVQRWLDAGFDYTHVEDDDKQVPLITTGDKLR